MTMQYEWKCGHVEWASEPVANHGNGAGQVKVTTLHWNCVAWDDAHDLGQTVNSIGTVSAADQNRKYPLPALQAVPEATFIKWVHQAMGDDEKNRIEADLATRHQELINPTHGGFTPAPPPTGGDA